MAASQSNVANETSVFDTISESLKQNYSAALDPVLVKQVSDAFAVFESQESSSVDVREVGTIIRSLGCCPSESELQQLVTAMEGESTNHFVTIEKFVPVVCGILQQKRFQSASEDLLVRAFRTLDTGKKGYLTRAELETALTGSGEPFSTDEMEEMWTAIRSLEQTSRPGTGAVASSSVVAASVVASPAAAAAAAAAPADVDDDTIPAVDPTTPIESHETVDYVSYTKFMMR